MMAIRYCKHDGTGMGGKVLLYERVKHVLRRCLAASRYVVIVAAVSMLIASLALILHQAVIVFGVLLGAVRGATLPTADKALAVGLIEAVDVFLIAIVAQIIGLGLYTLFVDDTLPLPRWLKIQDFDDLKRHLVSIVVAVLAVLFLREAVERAGQSDLLSLAAALSLMIAALTFFLSMRAPPKE